MRCCFSCVNPCELIPTDKLDASQEVEMPPPLDWEIYAEDVYTGDCQECQECSFVAKSQSQRSKGSNSSLDLHHDAPRVVAVHCASETDAMSLTGSLSTRHSPAASSSSDVTDIESQAFHSCHSGLNTLTLKSTKVPLSRLESDGCSRGEYSGHDSSLEGDHSKMSGYTSATTDRDSPDSGVCVFEEEILAVSKCRLEASMVPGDRTRLETYDSATLSPGAMTDDSDTHQQAEQMKLVGVSGPEGGTPRRPGPSSVRDRCTELERLFVAREKAARRLQRKALFHHAHSAPAAPRQQGGDALAVPGKAVQELHSLETAVSGALKSIFSELAVSAVQRLSTMVSGIRTSQVLENAGSPGDDMHERLMRPSQNSEVDLTPADLAHTGANLSAPALSRGQHERKDHGLGSQHRRNHSRLDGFSKQGFSNQAFSAGHNHQQRRGFDQNKFSDTGELAMGANSAETETDDKPGLLPMPKDFDGLPPDAFLGCPALARPGLLPTPAIPPSQGCIPQGVGTQFLQPILPKHPKGLLAMSQGRRQEGPYPPGRRRPPGSRRGRYPRGPEGVPRSRSQDGQQQPYRRRQQGQGQGQGQDFSAFAAPASGLGTTSHDVSDLSLLPPALPVTEEMLAEAQKKAATAIQVPVCSQPHRPSQQSASTPRPIPQQAPGHVTPVQSTPMMPAAGKPEAAFQEILLSEIMPVKNKEPKMAKQAKPKTNFMSLVKGGLSNLFRSA